MLEVHLLKTNKELKNLCKQEIQVIFIKMILIKLFFNMICLMINLKIWVSQSDEFLRDKAFKIASNPKYDG